MELVTVSKRRGHYDWAHPNVSEIQYIYEGIPADAIGNKRSVTVKDEYMLDLDLPEDDYLPISFTDDLLCILKKEYLYHPDIKILEKVLDYLTENNAEQEKLWYKRELEKAIKERDNLEKRLKGLNNLIKTYQEEFE